MLQHKWHWGGTHVPTSGIEIDEQLADLVEDGEAYAAALVEQVRAHGFLEADPALLLEATYSEQVNLQTHFRRFPTAAGKSAIPLLHKHTHKAGELHNG